MPLDLVTLPCLSDNYAYLVHDPATGRTAAVDVPEAAPILVALKEHGWRLTDILITHHHPDHIDGVDTLRQATGARVWGAAADAHRLPQLDETLAEGSRFQFGSESVDVIETPGHTIGHIAYLMHDSGFAFTGDSLMAGGCGRLFEGTAAQMHHTMQKFTRLSPDTLICSGHEYTASNLRFAATVDPDNPALADRIARVATCRAKGQPTVPALLQQELATNPYLRAHVPAVKATIGLPHATDAEVFAEIRARKDNF